MVSSQRRAAAVPSSGWKQECLSIPSGHPYPQHPRGPQLLTPCHMTSALAALIIAPVAATVFRPHLGYLSFLHAPSWRPRVCPAHAGQCRCSQGPPSSLSTLTPGSFPCPVPPQETCARILLYRGANKDVKNNSGQTPFQVWVGWGHGRRQGGGAGRGGPQGFQAHTHTLHPQLPVPSAFRWPSLLGILSWGS